MKDDEREKVLVSACLMGEPCRYDGTACTGAGIERLAQKAVLIAVCPEVAGGLPVPREPCEISDDRVVSKSGSDMTAAFARGANEAVRLAREAGCRFALLKRRSPSCGFGEIYDGTFSGALVQGSGLVSKALADAGVEVFDESGVDELWVRLMA